MMEGQISMLPNTEARTKPKCCDVIKVPHFSCCEVQRESDTVFDITYLLFAWPPVK